MDIKDVMPFIRFCSMQRYTNSPVFRDGAELMAYDCRLFYCLDGNGEIIVEGVPYHISEGCLLAFRYNLPYRYVHSEKRDMACISINFDFTFDFSEQNKGIIPPDLATAFDTNSIVRSPTLFSLIYLKNAKELENNILQLKNYYEGSSKYKDHELSALMKLIITRVFALYESENSTSKPAVLGLIEKICSYIDENCESISSGQQVAECFSYHSYYINRLMVRYKSCTLHEYIRNAKIQRSIEYLMSTEFSVAQIAEMCGFCDSAHFSRQFKNVTGFRPSKYRYM